MQSEKPPHEVLIENARSRMENSRSRQMLSADARVDNSRGNEKERLARQAFFEGRSAHLSVLSRGEDSARENAPWAFEITNAFSEKINHGDSCAKVHVNIEFTQFDILRGTKTVDEYSSGLLSATLHLEAEPNLPKNEMLKWAEEMRSNIIRDANGLVSQHTGVRKPYHQKGMTVEFKSRFGVEPVEQNAEDTWKTAYAPTEKKKSEIKEFLGIIEKTIDNYNDRVSKYACLQGEGEFSGLVRE